MKVIVETNKSKVLRKETGLFSLDMAFADLTKGQLGLPLNSFHEFYGAEHIGKSTLVYYLAGKLSDKGRIVLCDFEGLDIDYVPMVMELAGFADTLRVVDAADEKGKLRSHEKMLTEMTHILATDEKAHCGIVDSVGAIFPTFQKESDVGEGMGAKRAVIVSDFMRAAIDSIETKNVLYDTPVTYFAANHAHSIVSGGYGHQSSGGQVLKHLSATRTFMYNSARDAIKRGDEVLAYVAHGKVEKLRYGGKGREFDVVIVPGHGVRPNLTAVIDCVNEGLAQRSSYVKIGDDSIERITTLVDEDLAGNDKIFEPFHELLEGRRRELRGDKLDEETSNEEV